MQGDVAEVEVAHHAATTFHVTNASCALQDALSQGYPFSNVPTS